MNADGTLNEHALHLVRAALDSVHASVAAAGVDLADTTCARDARRGEAAAGAVPRDHGRGRRRRVGGAEAREARNARQDAAASSCARLAPLLGDAYEDWAGPPERVAKAKRRAAEAAAARLLGDFAAFRMYATTHPEIAPLLRSGASARRELPQRLPLPCHFAPDGEGGGRGGAAPPATGFGVMEDVADLRSKSGSRRRIR